MRRLTVNPTSSLAILVATFLASGCTGDQGTVVPPVPPPPSQAAVSAPPLVTGPIDPADRQEVIEDNTAFALDLYAKLAAEKKDANLFFSPYSLSSALAMTCTGARGKTAEQMKKALRLSVEDAKLHAVLASLTDGLNEGDPAKRGCELVVANALWGQKGYKFLDPFLDLNKACYRAGLNQVDFKGNAEGARQTINAWVEKQTRDKIKELIPPRAVDALTRLALTNAVYFKGAWARPFSKQGTRELPFRIPGAAAVNVATMYQEEYFKFLRNELLEALELPYAGNALSMVALLPRKVDGLPELEKQLTARNLAGWLKALDAGREVGTVIYLPRFTSTSSFSLAKTLEAMGMVDAFAPKAADFSGMNGKRPPDAEALSISAVLHKAFVDVNEEGTEAAAATALLPRAANGGGPPVFKADHPFVFLIRDKRSGSVLFLGRMVNPKQQ
jgi:serpin B